MATRCGALDPGAVLHFIMQKGMSPVDVEDLLYRRSGLLGISGISADSRELIESAAPEAAEALESRDEEQAEKVRLNDKAIDLLDPDYLERFQIFSGHSLEASLRGLLQIQYLGVDIVLDIVQESPNLRIVPPEKMGIIKTIFSNMFLKGR